jgi:hypothetical protein
MEVKKLNTKQIEEISCDEFRSTGLLTIINQILHIFGICIVVSGNKMYPARTKFRGFSESTTEISYEKISEYMSKSSHILKDEVIGDDDKENY